MKELFENFRKFDEATRADKEGVKLSDLKEVLYKYSTKNEDSPEHFMQFTQVPMLSMNPGSSYDTPLGIYSYPITDKVLGRMFGENQVLPFAQDREYINVFKVKPGANILTHQNATMALLEKSFDTLSSSSTAEYLDPHVNDWRVFKHGHLRAKEDNKSFTTNDNASLSQLVHQRSKGSKSPFAYIWSLCRWVSSPGQSEASKRWRTLMHKFLKIDGVYDHGEGVIHDNEPQQAVFFTKQAVESVDLLRNTYTPLKKNAKKITATPAVSQWIHETYTEVFGRKPTRDEKKPIQKNILESLDTIYRRAQGFAMNPNEAVSPNNKLVHLFHPASPATPRVKEINFPFPEDLLSVKGQDGMWQRLIAAGEYAYPILWGMMVNSMITHYAYQEKKKLRRYLIAARFLTKEEAAAMGAEQLSEAEAKRLHSAGVDTFEREASHLHGLGTKTYTQGAKWVLDELDAWGYSEPLEVSLGEPQPVWESGRFTNERRKPFNPYEQLKESVQAYRDHVQYVVKTVGIPLKRIKTFLKNNPEKHEQVKKAMTRRGNFFKSQAVLDKLRGVNDE